MKRLPRRKIFVPRGERLESRRLLSVTATYLGLGDDVVGPTAAVGPDGLKDIHLQLSNIPVVNSLPTVINSLTITAPGAGSAFKWTYGTGGQTNGLNPTAGPAMGVFLESAPNNTNGTSNLHVNSSGVTVFYPATTETFDLFINPTIDSIDPATGIITSYTLQNDPLNIKNKLDISVTYTTNNNASPQNGGVTTTEFWPSNSSLQVTATGLTGSLADTPQSPPLYSYGDGVITATFLGQNPVGATDDGMAHISISGLTSGVHFVTDPVYDVALSDEAGLVSNYGTAYGRTELGLTVTYPTSTSVDLAFPPLRDEAGSTMTLRFTLTDSSKYILEIPVPENMHTCPNLLTPDGSTDVVATDQFLMISPTSASTPDMVSYVDSNNTTQIDTLQNVLDMADPASPHRHTKFMLTDGVGSTPGLYTLATPLTIKYGTILAGADSNVNLQFNFTSVPSGSPIPNGGAINLRSI